MVSRPRLYRGPKLAGLAAILLFVVLAGLFVMADLPEPATISPDADVTASIGYALFDLDGGDVASEGFLAAFEIIDVVLVAALVGAVMLARREGGGPLEPTDDGGED